MADVIASLREKVKIRSVLTCKSLWRLPQVLWTQPRHGPQGRNRRSCRDHCRPGHRGWAQLTMRTFHTGGVAGADDVYPGSSSCRRALRSTETKHPGILSESAGTVGIPGKGRWPVCHHHREDGGRFLPSLPYGAKLHIADGDHVEVGDRLTEGPSIRTISCVSTGLPLRVTTSCSRYSVSINPRALKSTIRHVEVMVRQMMRKYRIDDAGDTKMLPGWCGCTI